MTIPTYTNEPHGFGVMSPGDDQPILSLGEGDQVSDRLIERR